MKAKIFTLSLLTAFLVFGLASAVSFSADSISFSAVSNQTITLTNTLNDSDVAFSLPGVNGIIFSVSPTSYSGLNVNQQVPVTVSIVSVPTTLAFGQHTSTLTATVTNGTDSISDTVAVTFARGFCSNGAVGNSLIIADVDVSSSGSDDEEWKFLDEITVEVEIENIGDERINDIYVELGLLDSSGKNVVRDLDFMNADNQKIDFGNLRSGDDEVAVFEFQVPADMDSGNYRLVVKAYSRDLGESKMCADSSNDLSDFISHSISIEEEDDEGKFIAFTNVRFSPSEVTCGDSVTLSFDAINVGDEDQDRVRVKAFGRDLGLDEMVETTNMDRGDKKAFSFSFVVPDSLRDGNYNVLLSSEYDYRSGIFRQESDDEFPVALRVIGCDVQVPTDRIASISANLDSEAVAGERMTVTARITNLLSTSTTFVISVEDYNSWAELADISDTVLTLSPGQSEEVVIEFNVDRDASSTESFTIEASSSGRTESRSVRVPIESSGSSLRNLFGNNALIWGIGLINLILIILIIVVAVKLSRR